MKAAPISCLLLALAGCSERPERLAAGLEYGAAPLTTAELPPEPLLVRRLSSGVPQFRTDTLAWADSTTRGDTTFFSRGRAITSLVVLTDSQWIRMPASDSGIPVGLFNLWDGTQLRANTEVFTLTYGSETPATLLTRLAIARSRGLRMVTSMTGGSRANYLTDGVFDMPRWIARMNRFNTPEIRAAVALAVSEGILIGNSVMDEPFNTGGPGNEANSWGPKGTMNKARVDGMCAYAKSIFPTLPHGVFQDYRLAPEESYRVCDFIISQYRTSKGSLAEYRDGAVELCRRDGHACAFAINVLDGGTPVRKRPGQSTYLPDDCPLTTTGGQGTYFPNCRMTPSQVREAGRTLGSAGCFLTGFRYDSSFMAKAENQRAFRDVIATLATRSAPPCIRS